MKMDEFIEKHKLMIHRTLSALFQKFYVRKCDQGEFINNAFGDLVIKCSGKKLSELDSSYVRSITYSSAVNTYYELHLVMVSKREPAETWLFSENPQILQNPQDFYGQTGVYKDRGGCSCFSENPIFGPFPGAEDLSQADLAVLDEFCEPQVEKKTRRPTLRRQVGRILEKLGIDSDVTHEYTSRKPKAK